MNAPRRKTISEIMDDLNALRDRLETVYDEESEYKDNIPENLQSSERYEKAESAVDNLDSALNSIDEILDYLEEATA